MGATDLSVVGTGLPELERYDAACRAIAEAVAVDELSSISDVARALIAAAKVLDNRESQLLWAEVHVLAEHRMGQLIKLQKATVGLASGARSGGTKNGPRGSFVEPRDDRPTLASVGITKKASSRSQKLSDIPIEEVRSSFRRIAERDIPTPTAILQERRTEKRQQREDEDKAKAAAIVPSFTIVHSAIEDVDATMLPDDSVDAIITDPPYPEKFLPTFSSLGALAARTLKPGGWLAVMPGNRFLPEVISRLGEHMTYRWAYSVRTPGGPTNRNPDLHMFQAWKIVLLYQKPPTRPLREWWPDEIVAAAREHDKSLHPWQQSEAVFSELVNRLTRPGDLVVDPFAGSGTTGRAATRIGRHFWGSDSDPECAVDVTLEAAE